MKTFIAILLCLVVPSAALASDSGYKVSYDGGSLPDVKTGAGLRLTITPGIIRISHDKSEILALPPASITEISYGQDVHRRVGAAIGLAVVSLGVGALMALNKSKKHFVGLTWAVGDNKGGCALQLDKNDYRGILTALEGVTGKKAVDSASLSVKN